MTHEQINRLYAAAIEQAEMLLKKQGEFFPFALSVKQDGSVSIYSAFDGEEHPSSAEVINKLVNGLRTEAQKNNITASAITYEVTGTFQKSKGQQSAICIALEHESSDPVTCYRPFDINDDNLHCDDTVIDSGETMVFETTTGSRNN